MRLNRNKRKMVRLGKVSLDKPLTSELWVQGSQSNKNLQSLFYSCCGQLQFYYLFFFTAIQKKQKTSRVFLCSLFNVTIFDRGRAPYHVKNY